MGVEKTICFIIPHYGKVKGEATKKLCNKLRHNGMVEENIVLWGDLIVLEVKPGK